MARPARKTESELLFESFCGAHGLAVEPVQTGQDRSPDYRVLLANKPVYFEVKQIDSDESFSSTGGVSSRTVGAHVRQKIAESRKQLQPSARAGAPCVLLIYNNLDHMQAFGTEPHDFLCAMYGEMTVRINDKAIEDSFYGRNAFLRQGHNTSFSAVGHLRRTAGGSTVCLYENAFARNPLDYASLPPCIEAIRVEVEANAPRG